MFQFDMGNLNLLFRQFRSMAVMLADGDGGGGDGGDGGGNGDAGGGDEGSGGTPGGTGRFTDHFADVDLKANPSLSRFENPESLAKSYISLERKLGANPITLPKEGASEAETSEFYKAIGRPDTADSYKLVPPKDLHKDISSTPESQKGFRAVAYRIGLTDKQAAELHGWYLTDVSNAMKQQDESDIKTANEAETALRSKWGTTYDGNIATVQNMINKFGGKQAQSLIDKGLLNDPQVLEFMANIGSKLSEDVLGPGGHSQYGAMTPAAAQAKKIEIMSNANHPYHNSGPLHKEAVQEMLTLNKIITGAV